MCNTILGPQTPISPVQYLITRNKRFLSCLHRHNFKILAQGWATHTKSVLGDPGAGAPLPIVGLPAPPPGGLVGLSDNRHCDCHLQVTVTVTNDVHVGLLVWLVQSQECVEQAMGPPSLSHPGWGGWGSVTARSPRSCRTVVSRVACALPQINDG